MWLIETVHVKQLTLQQLVSRTWTPTLMYTLRHTAVTLDASVLAVEYMHAIKQTRSAEM
jgi:hypothetical protein